MIISPAPVIQGAPIPLATTAAWLVIPPLAVTTPLATCIPVISSGDVSSLKRITGPSLHFSAASWALNTIVPHAAPGEAGRPLIITSFGAFGSIDGWSNWLIDLASIKVRALLISIIPSLYKSTAILTAALPVLLPLLCCKRYNLLSWIVNSISCISL